MFLLRQESSLSPRRSTMVCTRLNHVVSMPYSQCSEWGEEIPGVGVQPLLRFDFPPPDPETAMAAGLKIKLKILHYSATRRVL